MLPPHLSVLARHGLIAGLLAAGTLTMGASQAQPATQQLAAASTAISSVSAPILRDVPYGPETDARLDVYLPRPSSARPVPILILVHGGAWRFGDKASPAFVDNKVAHWVPQGAMVVSVNYPMLPASPPLAQVRHLARAIARIQADAPSWGGDVQRIAVIGHSAEAHLARAVAHGTRRGAGGRQGQCRHPRPAEPWRHQRTPRIARQIYHAGGWVPAANGGAANDAAALTAPPAVLQ